MELWAIKKQLFNPQLPNPRVSNPIYRPRTKAWNRSVSFSFDIKSGANFAASRGSRHDSIRNSLFGKPLRHEGLRISSSLLKENAVGSGGPTKLVRRKPKASRPVKAAEPVFRPHDERYVSELVRNRHPVEYLGYLITNEQQADGSWVASFVRMGEAADCAQCSAPHPASYMAFSDAKRQIDAALSGPASNRKYERVLVALEGAVFAAGTAQECQILDLSPGGARLRLSTPLPSQKELHLYIKGFGRFPAQIVRNSDTEIALQFVADNESVLGLLRGLSNYVKGLDAAQTKQRKEVRVPVSLAAVCRMADGAAIPCEIIDASMQSMSLRISERPRIGSIVTLGGAKVRVVRHHSQGIAVQCLPAPSAKFDRFNFKDD